MSKGKLLIKEVADVSELAFVREVALRTWPHTFAEILTPQQIEYMLEMMYSLSSLENQYLNKQHQFAIRFENGNPLGFAGYEINKEQSNTKIHKLYFIPEFHGKGYGKEMIEYIKAISSIQDIDKLTLNVNRYNKAINFYEHLGFAITGEEVIDIGSGYVMDDYIMDLKLS